MKWLRRLKFVFQLKRSVPFLLDVFRSPQVSAGKKLLCVALLGGYLFFPFDAIPDFLTFFGFLDDVMILSFVLQQIVKMAPPELKAKHGVSE